MKTIKILCALLVLFAVSCKTTKVAQKTAQVIQTEQRKDINEKDSTHYDSHSTIDVLNHSLSTDSVSEYRTEIELSKPDTAGKQYPMKIIITGKTDMHKVQSNISTAASNMAVFDRKNIKSDNSTVKQKVKTTNDSAIVSKHKTPAWTVIVAIILSLGVLLLVFMVLKRFKLIK